MDVDQLTRIRKKYDINKDDIAVKEELRKTDVQFSSQFLSFISNNSQLSPSCKGIAVIVANDYHGTELNKLSGALEDQEKMSGFFTSLGNYFVITPQNIGVKMFMSICAFVAEYKYSTKIIQRIVLYFAGHGGQVDGKPHITMNDEKPVLIEDIEAILGQSSVDIAKILLFDACRGSLKDPGTRGSGGANVNGELKASKGNFLIAYASLRGHSSGGDESGGYWTSVLHKKLFKLKEDNIVSILQSVNSVMSKSELPDKTSTTKCKFQPCEFHHSLSETDINFWKDAGFLVKSPVKVQGFGETSSIEEIKLEFAKMTTDVKEALKKKNICVRNLIDQLYSMDAIPSEVDLRNVTSIDDLWTILSKDFWHYYDYDILVRVVNLTDCQEARDKIDCFAKKLISTLKNVNLVLHCKEILQEGMPNPIACLRIKVFAEECTIDTIVKVKEIVAKSYEIEKYQLIPRSINMGCIQITYCISHAVMTYLLKFKVTGSIMAGFAKHHIISLQINNRTLEVPHKITDMEEVFLWSSQPCQDANLNHTEASDIRKPLDITNMLSKQIDKIVTSLSPEDIVATLSMLKKIYIHPKDFRIKLADKTFSSKVWRYPACEELLKMSGWVVEDDHMQLRDDSHIHIVSQLLESLCREKGVDQAQVSSSGISSTKYSVDKCKAFISAVLNNNILEIKHLLKPCNISNAGRIYCEDGSSVNLMLSAILFQKIDVVKLLVKEYSVDPYVVDEDQPVVYEVIINASQSFTINFLIICGVKTSFKDAMRGFTLLHYAVLARCFQVVCFLVEECGANVNMCDNKLDTPLHIAFMAGHTHIAEYLIKRGANEMAKNSRDKIPCWYLEGIPPLNLLSQKLQNQRKVHEAPGSAVNKYYISLCNSGYKVEEAVDLTMKQLPSLTEDGPTQPHHDVDHTSFTKKLSQYITKNQMINHGDH